VIICEKLGGAFLSLQSFSQMSSSCLFEGLLKMVKEKAEIKQKKKVNQTMNLSSRKAA